MTDLVGCRIHMCCTDCGAPHQVHFLVQEGASIATRLRVARDLMAATGWSFESGAVFCPDPVEERFGLPAVSSQEEKKEGETDG